MLLTVTDKHWGRHFTSSFSTVVVKCLGRLDPTLLGAELWF